MAFKLKSKGELFGINEELSEFGRPVFEKNMGAGIMGEANRDGTTFVAPNLSDKQKQEVVDHENKHHKQMQQNKLYYDDEIVIWKKDTKSPPRVYKRLGGSLINMKTGESDKEGGDFEWEREAYRNT